MYSLALPIFEENVARRKRLFGEDHPRTLDSLFNLAILWRRREDYSRALRLFDDLVEGSSATPAPTRSCTKASKKNASTKAAASLV